MSKELIVSSGRHETRVAILEDDQVVELFHEREKEYSLAGSIHKGCVTRVLPGMQSAFVDIGLERDAFLYVSDFFEDNEEYDAVVSTVEEKVLKMEKGGVQETRPEPVRAEPARQPAGIAPVESPVAEAAAPETSAAPAVSGNAGGGQRNESGRDGRPDRGGRGRRGRRRRGGRGSGLPESKFFSPKAEPAGVSEPEAETEDAQESEGEKIQESTPVSRAVPLDDFMVLPGESLAKYSPSESVETPEPQPVAAHEVEPEPEPAPVAAREVEPEPEPAPVAAREVEPEPEPEPAAAPVPVQAALPDEHPLAGFGAVASWVTPTETESEESSAIEIVMAEVPVEADTSTGDDEGLSSADVVDAEIAQDAAAAVFAEENAPAAEEGPEPARIPTSLTAQLREQGHRYPHRVSRRMRRKMRGDQRPEDAAKQPSTLGEQPEAAVEEKTVATPRDERRGEERREPREPQRGPKERVERDRPPLPSIADLLKEGQEIIVQIAKEPLGQKGARITSHIALPGRFVVYMPTVEHVGVSRKIPSDEERQRLKRVLQTHRQGIPGGFICRTAAENKSEEELKSDMHFLYNLWLDMRQKAEKKPAPVLLHHDLDLVQRILRDQLTTSFKTIWVDNEELFESILSFVQRFQPALVGRVKLYTRTNPIFDEFGITSEIEKALRPKVWLKSGGYIVINQTEALVAIDINTGKYVGKSNRLEDTIVKINTDAVREIVRQIRLRDLGGIIVVDFIDMDERKNRQKVMLALEESMRADRAPYKILQFNDFGLVAITRKRVKQSLERTLCAPCSYCEGAGYIKSVATVIGEILQEAQKMRKELEPAQTNLVLRVNPEVAKVLKSNQNSYLQEIEEIVARSVLVKSDPLLHQTKFDLA